MSIYDDEDALVRIWSMLNPRDLAQCSGVCRNWRKIIVKNDTALWKPICDRHHIDPGQNYSSFAQVYWYFKKFHKIRYDAEAQFVNYEAQEQRNFWGDARIEIMMPRIAALREVFKNASPIDSNHKRLLQTKLLAMQDQKPLQFEYFDFPRYPPDEYEEEGMAVQPMFGDRQLGISNSGGESPILQWPSPPKVVVERTLATAILQNEDLSFGLFDEIEDDSIYRRTVGAWIYWNEYERKKELIDDYLQASEMVLSQIMDLYSHVYTGDEAQDATTLLRIYLSIPPPSREGEQDSSEPEDFGDKYDACVCDQQGILLKACELDRLVKQWSDTTSPQDIESAQLLQQEFTKGGIYDAKKMVYRFLRYSISETVECPSCRVRQHALLALLPLLAKLSIPDCKLLVYSIFADYHFSWALEEQSRDQDPSRFLFSCALPKNIVQAMISFLLDGRFIDHHESSDFDHKRLSVLPVLAEQAISNPSVRNMIQVALGDVIDAALFCQPNAKRNMQKDGSFRMWESSLPRCLSEQDARERVSHRVARINNRGTDYQCLDRKQMGEVVEYIIDCGAVLAAPAVRRLYGVNPGHINPRLVSYGDCGFVAVLYLLGIGNQIEDRDMNLAGRRVSQRIVLQNDANGFRQMVRESSGGGAAGLASRMRASGSSVLDYLPACDACGNKFARLQACSRCHQVQYCGRNCQRSKWPKHKQTCGLNK